MTAHAVIFDFSRRRYLSRKRQEDGFDLSGPEKPWGEYTVFKGVRRKVDGISASFTQVFVYFIVKDLHAMSFI